MRWNIKNTAWLLVFLMLVISLLGGCTNDTDNEKKTEPDTEKSDSAGTAKPADNEEVVITVLYPHPEENFKSRFGTISEKLKNIKLVQLQKGNDLESLQELNAAKTIPDLIWGDGGAFEATTELDMIEPLDELVEVNNFDLSTIEPSIIATYRAMNPNGSLIGMPTFSDNFTLYYNKDVFDKFGIPYPQGNLTWDDIVDLSKKLTGERDGMVYRGFEFGGYGEALVPLKQFSVNLTDPDTGEVLIDKLPEVTKYLELMKRIYSIPGMYSKESYQFPKGNVGMIVTWPQYLMWGIGDADIVKNVDAAPLPSWPELPGVSPTSYSHPIILNKYSKNKDAAFKVMAEFVSVENQSRIAKKGVDPSVLIVQEVRDQYAVDQKLFEGKNIKAFFASKPALPPSKISPYDKYVDINGSLAKFAESDMNIPEFLRKLKEESEAKIKDAISKQK
ncbi:ABC transporter substrate-binding protein [Paenibacillus mendelii]|uniref:ABC transporter substrate-binding protein n=1 Tax=Paenibacillus mendelii TaxID=206163 RepID=A0ABV6J2M5_9BACL|nr:extracellular solute-binding protein [Paenibacillus mendelii]MCQ6563921.1 extracellular solute-binding protein [Paenibacillus mendelii]